MDRSFRVILVGIVAVLSVVALLGYTGQPLTTREKGTLAGGGHRIVGADLLRRTNYVRHAGEILSRLIGYAHTAGTLSGRYSSIFSTS